MQTPIRVEASGLAKSYGRQSVLKGLSLSVLPGECVGLLGGSGCGKSTLLRLLAGLQEPDAGTVRLDGRPPSEIPAGTVGFVPQDDIVHLALRVESALSYSARLRLGESADLQARVDQTLDLLDLTPRRRARIGRLSGGQRKRVSIGVELLGGPGLLFLDEPTSGLDPALEEHFMELFRTLADGGRTVLLTTHVLQSLNRLDLVAVLGGGRLAWYGPPSEMLSWFGVREAREVYSLLTSEGAALASRYASSSWYRDLVLQRLGSSP
jgi:putative ABC transport system ATP-binding protein